MRSIPPMQFDTMIDRACAAAGIGIESANEASAATQGLTRRSVIIRTLVIDQDTQRSAIEIVKLSAAQRPEKGPQSEQAQAQRNGDQDGYARHLAAPFNRNAFATTMTDEPDMASAAINGVTIPMIAIGTATRL